eukprot:scaffold4536_cov113-Isochrysis_galbana.AAC.4
MNSCSDEQENSLRGRQTNKHPDKSSRSNCNAARPHPRRARPRPLSLLSPDLWSYLPALRQQRAASTKKQPGPGLLRRPSAQRRATERRAIERRCACALEHRKKRLIYCSTALRS